MATFDFETPVNRTGTGNMKGAMQTASGENRNILVLSGAEMDFMTAPVIRKAVADFAMRGIYGFTLPDESYLDKICHWMQTVRNLEVKKEEIVPTLGTIMGLNTAIRAFTKPGDGVIIQHPSYYRHDVAVKNNGREVVSNLLQENDGIYQIDFSALEEQMSKEKNKLLILCNPHNPTGKIFTRDDLIRISELSRKYEVIVFSDEIFAEITFDSKKALSYADIDETYSIISTSLGKVFNFTGVNQANLIIKNPTLRDRYLKQRKTDHFGSLDPFFYTALHAGYSRQGYEWITQMCAHVWQNYQTIKNEIEKNLPYIGISPLEGGFVLWADFRRLGLSDSELQERMEKDAGILGDPGWEYGPGGSGFYRFNIAVPHSVVPVFLERIKILCESQHKIA